MKLTTLTVKELRAKKPAEIEAYIKDLSIKHNELRHALSVNKEKQTHYNLVIRKAIAKAKTVLTEHNNMEKEK